MLADSLAMWDIVGTVEVGEPPTAAIVRTAGGRIAWVEASCDANTPFRWIVRWCEENDPAGASPPSRVHRGCASLVGVLGALRGAFAVQLGCQVRVASVASQ